MRTTKSAARVLGLAWLLVAAPMPALSQGWIEPTVAGAPGVAKVRSEVRVRVDGRIAQVEVSEWFSNGGGRPAQGDYLYPLPGEAVFQGFSLFQGDAELRGEIMDAEHARRIYEEIVRRRLDPALIELAGHGLLRARVFPIAPGEERKVTLRYTQVLGRAGGALQLLYAGAVRRGDAPRAEARPAHGSPRAVETSFEVTVENGDDFLEPFSPTHAIHVERSSGRMTVRLNEELVGRLSLFLPTAGDVVGVSIAAHRPPGEEGYFMLTLSPGRDAGEPEPRDVTAVLDVSGSMSGEKIEQARAALHALLGSLSREDRFRLIAFSNAVRMYSDDWAAANGRTLADASRWIDALGADGGTNIGAALDEAFRLDSPPERLPVVIFLTDGLPSVGEQSPERLADRAEANAGRRRVFAFGVGHDVNTHLLDRLGEAGRGDTDYVEPGENVERVVALLAAKIRHPVLTDLRISGAPVELREIYPVTLPDVFAGQELVLFGRYRGDGEGRLSIRGRRAGGSVSFAADALFPRTTEANAYIPRLWASRKLGHLERQIWTEGSSQSLVQEIRTLALRYALPSAYTSYLVQEPGVVADRPASRPVDVLRAPTSLAPAPSQASGAGAVRIAEAARSRREVASMAGLRDDELALAEEVARADASTRMVAGRLFRLVEGVWTDVTHDPKARLVEVKAFGRAYFALSAALPELAGVLQSLDRVVVAGEGLSIEVGPEGADTLSERELREVVELFRATTGS